MRASNLAVTALLAATTSGCATITSSDVQSLSLTAHGHDGKPVEKAQCSLKNDKGNWQVQSPGFVDVRRSSEDLFVECRKDGHPDGFLKAVSRVAGGMFGNIVFGGGIGAIIDHSRGTGYNYPDKLPVRMGQSVVVDRRDQQEPAAETREEPTAPADGRQ